MRGGLGLGGSPKGKPNRGPGRGARATEGHWVVPGRRGWDGGGLTRRGWVGGGPNAQRRGQRGGDRETGCGQVNSLKAEEKEMGAQERGSVAREEGKGVDG